MQKITIDESAHTADALQAQADESPADGGLPNRLLKAFEESYPALPWRPFQIITVSRLR
jgi:hypothetical protein